MIFKRKKSTRPSEMFIYEPEDRQKLFRVQPSISDPVFLQMDEKTVRVISISAGDIAFENHNHSAGLEQHAKINLPDQTIIEPVKIKIVSIDENNICRAEYIDMKPTEKEKVLQYALKRQIEIARKNNEVKYRDWHMWV